MAKALKQMLVGQLRKDLSGATGILFLETGPMTVEGARAFRRDLKDKAGGARLRIVQNRTAVRALEAHFFANKPGTLKPVLKGPSAIAFGGDGPVSIAKVVLEWRRKFKPLRVKGAVSDGELLGAKDAEQLATLPGLPELRGKLVGCLVGPARGVLAALQAAYGGVVRSVNQRVEKSGGAEAGAGPAGPAAPPTPEGVGPAAPATPA